jgi:hypothetical protein
MALPNFQFKLESNSDFTRLRFVVHKEGLFSLRQACCSECEFLSPGVVAYYRYYILDPDAVGCNEPYRSVISSLFQCRARVDPTGGQRPKLSSYGRMNSLCPSIFLATDCWTSSSLLVRSASFGSMFEKLMYM